MQYRVVTTVRLREEMPMIVGGRPRPAAAFSIIHGVEAANEADALACAGKAALEDVDGWRIRQIDGRIRCQVAQFAPPSADIWLDDERERFVSLDTHNVFYASPRILHLKDPTPWWWGLVRPRRIPKQVERMTRRNTPVMPGWLQLPSPQEQPHEDALRG